MQNKIRAWWEKERWQAMLWLPVPIGVGVGIYFHLHDEPPLWMAVSPFIISLILLIGVGIYKVNCHPPRRRGSRAARYNA